MPIQWKILVLGKHLNKRTTYILRISPCCNINTTKGEIPRLPPHHENLTLAFPPSHPSQKYHKTAGFPTPSLLDDIICERPLAHD